MPPPIPDKIPCESVHELEREIATLRGTLSLEETEETWDRIARALTRFGAVVKGGGYKFEPELVSGVRASIRPITHAMNSERTLLSAAALECVTIIAPRIGLGFDPLVPLFVPHILRLSTRSNKVYVTRSQASLGLILGYCHLPSIIPLLLAACKESKIATGRAVAVEGVLRSLNKWDWMQKEIKNKVGDVEEIIRITGRDKDAGIRQTSRKVFEAYKTLFPERVDDFTGPLTPVMKKYLDIRPKPLAQQLAEPVRPLSAHEKSSRPPTRTDLASSTSAVPTTTTDTEACAAMGVHVRSASSNAVMGRSYIHSQEAAAAARAMPPPAIVPSRAKPSKTQPHSGKQDNHKHHERQRVISTASSTYSTQSAPPNSHSEHEHQPPARLACSQSRSVGPNTNVAASSGQARRVRKVVPVEPHPANRPDPRTVAHKAPVRPTPLPGTNGPRVFRPHILPSREGLGGTQSAPPSATRVTFPTIESHTVPLERKGAQRVPKPAPASHPTPAAHPKVERPPTATGGVVSKRETKPSIFRRGAPGAPGLGEKKGPEQKEGEQKKEGFAPRRGGGITQPTLSQLCKQRAHAVTNTNAPTAVASSRPAWGSGGIAKTAPRGLVGARGRGPAVQSMTAKRDDKAKVEVKPAMIPLPASPGRERDAVPQLVPLPESPRATATDTVPMDEQLQLNENAATVVPRGLTLPEQDMAEHHTEKAPEAVQNAIADPVPVASAEIEDRQDVFESEEPITPHTPPFPPTDSDSEDELDAIEFTTGDAYGPGGVPVKTPRKVACLPAGSPLPERNPLGEVALNA